MFLCVVINEEIGGGE